MTDNMIITEIAKWLCGVPSMVEDPFKDNYGLGDYDISEEKRRNIIKIRSAFPNPALTVASYEQEIDRKQNKYFKCKDGEFSKSTQEEYVELLKAGDGKRGSTTEAVFSIYGNTLSTAWVAGLDCAEGNEFTITISDNKILLTNGKEVWSSYDYE